MHKNYFFIFFLLIGLPRLAANSYQLAPILQITPETYEPHDLSRADTDGPYVFHKGSGIVVKSIFLEDSSAKVKTEIFQSAYNFNLSCHVTETEDKFSFPLHGIPEAEPSNFPAVNRLLVLSDIEGNFKALKTMLIGAKVMDKDFNWSFGDGHLVLVGDFFDRGLQVTECLWLIYKLEAEAIAANGKVHFILGNHEIINLQGNSQYARRKYLENTKLLGLKYSELYAADSELGRWLRSKNAIELIGDYGFCHGGISMELATRQLSINDINRISRANLGKALELMGEPERSVFDLKTGIFWFRGMARNQMAIPDVRAILKTMGIRRLVIGHTLQSDLTALYGGKVICIDLFHEENLRQGTLRTLYIEDGLCFSLNSRGQKASAFSVYFGRKAEND
jgi:Calcineurin-like phosphoesterase